MPCAGPRELVVMHKNWLCLMSQERWVFAVSVTRLVLAFFVAHSALLSVTDCKLSGSSLAPGSSKVMVTCWHTQTFYPVFVTVANSYQSLDWNFSREFILLQPRIINFTKSVPPFSRATVQVSSSICEDFILGHGGMNANNGIIRRMCSLVVLS